MAGKATYKSSFEGIGMLLRSDGMLEAMAKKGEKVRILAEDHAAVSPLGSVLSPSGAYKKSFKISLRKDGGVRGDRAEAMVYSDSPVAEYVEKGTRTMRGEHTLLRALFEALRR
jgi:hypothetical protein